MIFHNTIHLSGEDLKKAVADAEKQEEAILLIFQNCHQAFTASDITRLTEKAGKKWPLHSNRRAITNLMNRGHLKKTDRTKIGLYGKPETFYQIKQSKAA